MKGARRPRRPQAPVRARSGVCGMQKVEYGIPLIHKMGYKEEFIKFMVESGVLTFGDFVTKSGRNTPYFINTGNYKTGAQAHRLGQFYASCIKEHMDAGEIDHETKVLFGPWIRHKSRKKIDKLINKGYNINKISNYANNEYAKGKYDEMYTEYRVKKLLGE